MNFWNTLHMHGFQTFYTKMKVSFNSTFCKLY